MLKVPTYYPELLHEYNNYAKLHDYCPFKFRANEDINLVGTYERNIQRDYCYMGFYYRREWVPFELNGMYRVSEWKDYLPYEERKKIYLSSIFALGFHADAAIDCGSISQRVFEGMAYGCIVLSDNPIAEKITDGIVVTVTSKEDVLQKINYYKENPELISEKQQKGYEWVKKYGTNRESVKTILNRIKEVYNMEFE
jgi:glycosyltransferase involved in cell wall biosynthesis